MSMVCLVWLPNTPDVEKLGDCGSEALNEEIVTHADQLVPTINAAADAPAPKVNPQICM